MKRDEVKTQIPGLTDEQLDWLMNENGKDITAEKGKATALQTQLTDLTAQLNTAKEGLKAFEGVDVNDLKGQITKLQGDMQAQADVFAFDAALDGAIRDARGRDIKAIRGMLDLEVLKGSKDRSTDIKTALETLAKEKTWAFEVADTASPDAGTPGGGAAEQGGIRLSSGASHGATGAPDYNSMSDAEYYAATLKK